MRSSLTSLIVPFLLVAEVSAMTIEKSLVRQESPWDGRVRIEYCLAGDADETATVDCFVRTRDGSLVCDTRSSLGGAWEGERIRVKPGYHVLRWMPGDGAAADADALAFALSVDSASEKYMIVDISNPDAYAVTYTNDIPASALTEEKTPGMDSNAYRETKIVLRHIRPGTFMMGSPTTETGHPAKTADGRYAETLHRVTLTNEFWIGVFPISYGQFKRVCPNNANASSARDHDGQGFAAGLNRVDLVGEGAVMRWPQSTDVDELADKAFLPRLRNRTRGQLPAGFVFSLPSEAQWEYACRAGTSTAFNDGSDCVLEADGVTCKALDALGYYKEDYNWMRIARFLPNAWGLYDCHGGVFEIVNDRTTFALADLGPNPVVEPKGIDYGNEYWSGYQVVRGGCASRMACPSTTGSAVYCRSAARRGYYDWENAHVSTTRPWAMTGFRLAVIREVQDGVETPVDVTPWGCTSRTLPAEGSADARRPYEMVWANRTADEETPLLPMTSADGWRVECSDAAASVGRSDEHLLFGDGTVRLTYRATGSQPEVRLLRNEPVPIPAGCDTFSLWVYGNNFYGWNDVLGVSVPTTGLFARFRDKSGATCDVALGSVHFMEWNVFRKKTPSEWSGAFGSGQMSFVGFVLRGGTNTADRQLDLTSFCVFRETFGALSFKAQPKRGAQIFAEQDQGVNVGPGRLPFPTDEQTVIPPCACADPKIEFRLPQDEGVWDDLAFRYGGGEWIPLAVGGGVFPNSSAGRRAVRFHREGNSLVADIERTGVPGACVKFGGVRLQGAAELVPVPFYTDGNQVWDERPRILATSVGGTPVFVSATMDWTQSSATTRWAQDVGEGLYELNSLAGYVQRTDGTYNDAYERFVWTVSTNIQETLPRIPNPVSPWKHVCGKTAWISSDSEGDRTANRARWRLAHRQGMAKLIITDHEQGWRDGHESNTFRTEPAPKKGGAKGQYDYARYLMDDLGYRYGPYSSFADLAPVNANWSADHVLRDYLGGIVESWARCYVPKPLFSLEKCAEIVPVLKRRYGFNTGYCDVHSAAVPWSRADCDFRVPGAATFAQTYYAYGQIFLIQKNGWWGPVSSEGGNHWLYAGLVDANYGQDRPYDLTRHPWLVDFHLLRMHPLCCDFMPHLAMFYGDGGIPSDKFAAMGRWFAAGLAFGQCAYLASEYPTYAYYMGLALASRYSQENIGAIRYADAQGTLHDTSAAVLNGAYRRNQIVLAYDGGTRVAVNGNFANEPMSIEWADGRLTLPPTGFLAVARDAVSYSGPLGANERCDFSVSPEYVYLNGRGRPMLCAAGGTSGEFVRLKGDGGTEEIIPFGMKDGEEIVLPYRATSMTGLDEDRHATGPVGYSVDGDGRTHLRLAAGCFSYLAGVPGDFSEASPEAFEREVMQR